MLIILIYIINILPRSHRNDLISSDILFPLPARCVSAKNVVDEAEEHLYPLILSQIFTALAQILILNLVVATNNHSLRTTYWGHDHHLRDAAREVKYVLIIFIHSFIFIHSLNIHSFIYFIYYFVYLLLWN